MKNMSSLLNQIKEEVSALPLNKGGKRQGIRNDLRRRIVHLYEQADLGGEEFCDYIGISYSAFNKWKRDFKDSGASNQVGQGFKSISIETDVEVSKNEMNNITIEGPCGLKIYGLNPFQVAALWQALC